jgi:hypothetical protein
VILHSSSCVQNMRKRQRVSAGHPTDYQQLNNGSAELRCGTQTNETRDDRIPENGVAPSNCHLDNNSGCLQYIYFSFSNFDIIKKIFSLIFRIVRMFILQNQHLQEEGEEKQEE